MRSLRYSIELDALPEECVFRGNCSAIDDETDRETEEAIAARLDAGDEWAWCIARVRVTDMLTGEIAEEFLGGCSYADAHDFRVSGYFDDMVQNCMEALT